MASTLHTLRTHYSTIRPLRQHGPSFSFTSWHRLKRKKRSYARASRLWQGGDRVPALP